MRVNVDEGFLPRFVPEFCETYGAKSIFVHAVSDLLTKAVAALMKANDRLVSEETIALFGSEQAEETLRELVVAVDGSVTLFQESCGFAPIGSFAELVDATFEEGCFLAWLKEFQEERFDAASKVIGRSE